MEGFPGRLVVKNPPTNVGAAGLIPGSGRADREGNDNPFQYSYLGNPLGRRAWWAVQPKGLQRVGHDWLNKQQPHKNFRPHSLDHSLDQTLDHCK